MSRNIHLPGRRGSRSHAGVMRRDGRTRLLRPAAAACILPANFGSGDPARAFGGSINMDKLEGYPVISLEQLSPRQVTLDEFRQAVIGSQRSRAPRHGALTTEVGTEGFVDVRYVPLPPQADPQCRAFLDRLCVPRRHRWRPERLVLLDQPCFLVVDGGTVLLEDGSILAETVYPSTGEQTIARRLGSGLNRENLARELRSAARLRGGSWAPLLCRWASVYYHALIESLGQDRLLASVDLSRSISYAMPEGPIADSRAIAIAGASSPLVRHPTPIVRPPRAVFSISFYRHATLGPAYLRCVESIKAELPPDPGEAPARIYVARGGATARPMTNEAELIAAIAPLGFHIFHGAGQSLAEQAAAFRNASLIVGAHGSGLANAAFAPAGATLFELRPLNRAGDSPMRNDEYMRLVAVQGLSYCAHVSANDPDSETWTADIPGILLALRTILRARNR